MNDEHSSLNHQKREKNRDNATAEILLRATHLDKERHRRNRATDDTAQDGKNQIHASRVMVP